MQLQNLLIFLYHIFRVINVIKNKYKKNYDLTLISMSSSPLHFYLQIFTDPKLLFIYYTSNTTCATNNNISMH